MVTRSRPIARSGGIFVVSGVGRSMPVPHALVVRSADVHGERPLRLRTAPGAVVSEHGVIRWAPYGRPPVRAWVRPPSTRPRTGPGRRGRVTHRPACRCPEPSEGWVVRAVDVCSRLRAGHRTPLAQLASGHRGIEAPCDVGAPRLPSGHGDPHRERVASDGHLPQSRDRPRPPRRPEQSGRRNRSLQVRPNTRSAASRPMAERVRVLVIPGDRVRP